MELVLPVINVAIKRTMTLVQNVVEAVGETVQAVVQELLAIFAATGVNIGSVKVSPHVDGNYVGQMALFAERVQLVMSVVIVLAIGTANHLLHAVKKLVGNLVNLALQEPRAIDVAKDLVGAGANLAFTATDATQWKRCGPSYFMKEY